MKKLSKDAFGGVKGSDYKPYVENAPKKSGSQLVLLFGLLLSALFAASTAYSGMKAGLTVAAGIPGAIIGSGLVSGFVKPKSILSTNILQLMSSGGESVASGIIFVMPAIILVGGKLSFLQGVMFGLGAVFFGVGVFSIVQKYMLIEEHGNLVYPESMAIAETLVVSENGGEALKFMGIGFGIGGLITAFTSSMFGLINNSITYVNESFYKWKISTEVNPLLVGVGFIVGIEVAIVIFAGSLFANFALVPIIGYFMQMTESTHHVWDKTDLLLNTADFATIYSSYVKYIGAGMMISGGIIGALKLIPTIISSISETLKSKKDGSSSGDTSPLSILIGAAAVLVAGFIVTGNFMIALVGGLLSIFLSFLFVIVAGRLTGTIGTSNLPVSGMTIASMVFLTLLFSVMGWTSPENIKHLLLFGTFIVLAISVAGGYAQSQKVTFVMGGNMKETRKYFIYSTVIGVIIVTGMIVILAPQLVETGSNPPFGLPQANLIATLTSGIISGELPWHMIIAGIVIGIILFMANISVMSFAMGVYLPISTTSIILVGAILRVILDRANKKTTEEVADKRVSQGISLSSGLIAGGSIIGLIGIILQVTGVITPKIPTGFLGSNGAGIVLLLLVSGAVLTPLLRIKE
ncbi:MAG: oligopeptide transporter, OPT family [Vagococcus sp.]|uniref:OPT family oligopeptide transporter n=1 Tax=Vagococcus sp. TaxID=1933889 RepID=UPI002FCB32C4